MNDRLYHFFAIGMLAIFAFLIVYGGQMRVSAEPMAQNAPHSATCTGLPDVETGESTQLLMVDDEERTYVLHVPSTYDPTQAYPLVMSFHGFTSTPAQQAAFSEWHTYAETLASEGEPTFVTVYPQGTGFPLRWNAGLSVGAGFEGADDVAFISALIDTLSETLCIDTTRIYANGLSNGAGMSNRLACNLSERITAIGGVAGAYPELPDGCDPTRPVPVMGFHGYDDPIAPYEGGNAGGILLPYIPDWAEGWAERNGCDMTPEVLPEIGDVEGVRYGDCEADAQVILYSINGGGHTWPGDEPGVIASLISGATNQDIDATAMMWAFFSQYALE